MGVKKWFNVAFVLSVALLVVATFVVLRVLPVQAADSDFSNGITVDSTLDTADANIGNGVCDDGDGNCTLRAAIQEANSNSDASTINFTIAGSADFTNQGEDGYTIAPTTALPEITQTVTINGYSQPGSQANTAIAPNPLNGRLLIELDGSGVGNSITGITADAENVTIRGLVINRFSFAGVGVAADNLTVQGNYIGTDPTGMIDRGNVNGGIMNGEDDSDNCQIGGLNPQDRNIVSGNEDGGSSPNNGSDHWVYQGNYFGVGADGLTALPNAQVGGAGALSLDNSDDHIVGGAQAGAINVISGNNSFGIAPHNVENLLIEGNYIGVGYDGETPVANDGIGIGMSEADHAQIVHNVISHNSGPAINIGALTDANSDIQIKSNHLQDNQYAGILINGTATEVMVGGTNTSDGNIITGNTGPGIAVGAVNAPSFPLYNVAESVSILGNTIYGNTPASSPPPNAPYAASGLGIDMFQTNIDNDFNITLDNLGPSLNDTLDPDTGSNGYLNFPILNSVTQADSTARISFSLDAVGSPTSQYRVEYFVNNEADPSGYGEGQTFLGSVVVANGSNQEVSLTLPAGLNLAGKSISATATTIDNTLSSGFGATSEFSPTRLAIQRAATLLAETGVSMHIWFTLSLTMLGGSAWLARRLTQTLLPQHS